MAISRQKKEELIKQYVADLKASKNFVIVQQLGITVPDATQIRKSVMTAGGKLNVIRKNLFIRALKEIGSDADLSSADGSVFVLYALEDEYAPLKVVNNALKLFVKEKKKCSFSYVGGMFDNKWNGSDYITELANVPSKEELIGKLAYLFNYPLQSFAGVLDQISQKKS